MQPPSNTMQPPSSPPSPRQPQSPPPLQTPPQPIPPPPGQAQPMTSPPPIITQPPPKPTPQEVVSPPSSSRKKAQVASPSSPLPPQEAISPPSSGKKAQVSSSPSSPLPPPPGRNESVTSPTEVPLSYPPHPNLTPNRATRATTHGKWSTGLFECFSDLRNCAITCLCPCITFGEISEIVDKGTTSCAVNGAIYTLMVVLVGFACVYSAFYRRRLRIQLNLEGSSCGDCCIHSFCEVCALCQEYRELRLRGFDLSLGRMACQYGETKSRCNHNTTSTFEHEEMIEVQNHSIHNVTFALQLTLPWQLSKSIKVVVGLMINVDQSKFMIGKVVMEPCQQEC